MIIDSLEFVETYDLGDDFEKAFDFLLNATADISIGRHEVDGDDVFALVSSYETKSMEGAELEVHRKYIDVQLLVQGEEIIGYCPLSDDLEVTTEYSGECEAGMLRQPEYGLTGLHMTPGRFAIFFPQDAHMPGIADDDSQSVKKIVVKIAV